ncbi:MAG: DUF599 family protein [Rhodospirillaceae bacterium]|nr:DUF599 family protein [Rhodospirillaceae bacterium]
MMMIDLIGLGLFAIAFFGYARIADLAGRGKNVNSLMHEVRRAWMQRMMERPDRIVDAALTGHTVNSMSFFSSATILVVAGLLGVLGQAEEAQAVVAGWVFVVHSSATLFQLKIIGLVAVFVYGFFRFTWALRQYNYCCTLIGAAPLAKNDYPHRLELADQMARVYTSALNSFGGGIRCYYFALAWLAWLIDPVAFIVATIGIMLVLLRRQVSSHSAHAIQRYVELNPPESPTAHKPDD